MGNVPEAGAQIVCSRGYAYLKPPCRFAHVQLVAGPQINRCHKSRGERTDAAKKKQSAHGTIASGTTLPYRRGAPELDEHQGRGCAAPKLRSWARTTLRPRRERKNLEYCSRGHPRVQSTSVHFIKIYIYSKKTSGSSAILSVDH